MTANGCGLPKSEMVSASAPHGVTEYELLIVNTIQMLVYCIDDVNEGGRQCTNNKHVIGVQILYVSYINDRSRSTDVHPARHIGCLLGIHISPINC